MAIPPAAHSTSKDAPAVTAVALGKHYLRGTQGIAALSDFSFELARGVFLGISGPSGCGKSTLLNIVGLTDAPSSGTLAILGEQINFHDERRLVELRRSRVGYVFQSFNLLPALTARENIMVIGLLNGAPVEESRSRADQILVELGLAGRAAHLPHQLSGGELQRIAVGRALYARPPLIVADEPTGNLDSHSGGAVLALLRDAAAAGAAVVMATHSAKALDECDEVILLSDGRRSS